MLPTQELYATSSKFDKLKISKAIVAAIRHFGGNFIQADEQRGGLYFDIGDKRAWDKTSQALREGQAEVREKLAEEPAGTSKILEYKQVISEQAFFAYACKITESLLCSASGESGISACGPECPFAKRRQTLHQLGANPLQIFKAMCSMAPPPLPPPQVMLSQPPRQGYSMQYGQPYDSSMSSGEASYDNRNISSPYDSSMPSGEASHNNHIISSSLSMYEPLAFNTPLPGEEFGSLDPLPYKQPHESLVQTPYTPLNATGQSQKPIAYQIEHLNQQLTSSIFSINNIFSHDFESSSEEGKELMALLNEEVDDLIRRKSLALIQIDTQYAFEDLMFEEDCEMSESVKDENPPRTYRNSSSTGSSILSVKDDVSLMNMSFLSLDDRRESVTSPYSAKEGMPRTSILLKRDSSVPTDIKCKGSRVGFYGGKNSSLMGSIMSMDSRSFSDLVECIKDPDDADIEDERSSSYSRKMGFPIRRSVIKKLGGSETPTEVRQEEFGAMTKRDPDNADADIPLQVGPNKINPMSSLTISQEGQVHNPLGESYTLKSTSGFNMSSMGLSMASIGASFTDLLNEDVDSPDNAI